MHSTQPGSRIRQYSIIFGIALLLRVLFLIMMLSQVDASDIPGLLVDGGYYRDASQAIASDFSYDSYAVLVFGPGYPSLLALAVLIGCGPFGLVVLQILASGTTAVIISAIAFQLTKERKIAMIAGLLSAVSLTSISLANALISETVFTLLFASGILLFLKGLDTCKSMMFLISAGLLALAALTRTVGQFIPVVLIVAGLAYALQGKRTWLIILRRMM